MTLGVDSPRTGRLTVTQTSRGLEIHGVYPHQPEREPEPRPRLVLPFGRSEKALQRRNRALMAKKARIQRKQRQLQALLTEKRTDG